MKKIVLLTSFSTLMMSCYSPKRDCKKFKTGTFEFTYEVNGEKFTNTFVRNDSLEFEFVDNKTDTNQVKWLNDCEWVVKKLNPKSNAEKKAVHMKILSTTEDSYIFEYNLVGSIENKQRGTATKIN